MPVSSSLTAAGPFPDLESCDAVPARDSLTGKFAHIRETRLVAFHGMRHFLFVKYRKEKPTTQVGKFYQVPRGSSHNVIFL